MLKERALLACVFLGAGGVSCIINPLFGVLLAKWYPSRFVAPAAIFVSMVTVLVHTALLDALRENPAVLYAVYLIISIVLVIVYLFLKPYLVFSFQSRPGEATRDEGQGKGEDEIAGKDQTTESGWRDILQANAYDPLSFGELEIAGLIMKGYQTKEMEKVLAYTHESIKTLRKRLYSKLQINKPSQLFERAQRVVKE